MSSGIAPVVAHPGAVQAPPDPRIEKLRHAAGEFESMLVKQMLKAAKIGGAGGDEKASGYEDMTVDALASAIEKGGGLGLARRIEQAIAHGVAPGAPNPHKGG
jgi:Rod binding domain-containing protein